MRVVLLVASGLALAGCQTKSVNEMSYSEVRQLAAELGNRCEAQGVRRGTPDWDACIKQEATREATIRANRREIIRRAAEGGGSCISTRAGAQTYTNCF